MRSCSILPLMKRSKDEMARLREWAKLLYVKEKRQQNDIAATVGVSAKTVGLWKEDGRWDDLRETLHRSKEERIRELYDQLNEFNQFIKNKPEGRRFSDSKEADALKKITTAIRDLEVELNISQHIDVLMDFNQWHRNVDYKAAQAAAETIDAFIKSKLS
jgi:uncharacterized protein YdcH (DUF465 family)